MSPTTEWAAVLYPNTTSDFALDEQAQSIDRDLVGDATHPAFYTRFWNGGTTDDLTDGEVGFRLRMAGDQPPPGFTGQAWVGVDVDDDGTLDIFVGANDSVLGIHNAGTDLNISPSTTSINPTPLWSTPVTTANYLWTPVTATIDPDATNFDIDNDKKPEVDFFLTFVVPFSEFVAAVRAVSGVADFDESSPLAYVAATSSQIQTLNSDLNGVDGAVNSSLTWTDLDAVSPIITIDGELYNIPEPSVSVLLAACAGLAVFFVHKRRR